MSADDRLGTASGLRERAAVVHDVRHDDQEGRIPPGPLSPTAPTYGSATSLLRSVEDRAASRRMRVLALYARDHAGTPHLTEILRQLETAGRGRLAVHMAAAARDTDTLALHLAGPDPELRRAALCALREPSLPDQAVPPVLDDAPTGLRRALYRTLYHARRTGLADSLLSRVRAEYGDAEAAALLPACSPAQVAAHLPGLRHAVRSWRRLARRHPDALLDLLREAHARGGWTFERLPDLRRVLQALDPVRPAELGTLLRELGEERRGLALLAPHTHRLLYRDGDERHYSTRYPAGPGGTRDIRRLSRHARHTPAEVLPVLRAMPLPVRTAHLDRIARRGDGYGALLLLPYLDLLPRDRAEAEARRALAEVTAFQSRSTRYGDPDKDLDAIAHLPYGEAAGPLEEAASAGDPDRRARGLARLVEATARTGDPRLLARVLTERAERSRAERDPVRRSLLCALSRVSPPLLARASLPALHRLLADTLGSRDTSADTRRALRDLAAALLRHPLTRQNAEATDWALEAYTGLVARFGARGLGERGRPRSRPPWWSAPRRWAARAALDPALDQVLPRGLERELYRRLAPALDDARARGDLAPAVALARELGRRAHGVPELREHLAAALGHDTSTTGSVNTTGPSNLRGAVAPTGTEGTTDSSGLRYTGTGALTTAETEATAREAAELYLTGPGARADARALFDADPSAARVPRVWSLLVRHAEPSALRTAFDAVGEHRAADAGAWVPVLDRRTVRDWPEELCARAADHLAGIADDPSQAIDDRERALRGLGALPGAADRLTPYLDGPDTVLREAALSALGRCDEPARALDLVLAHADGPRSRAAGPALSRCAKGVAPSRLGPALCRVLDGPAKVTVRKAAARLLEHHRPPGGIEHLARVLDTGDGLHRDVRAAVAGALMRALDHPEALPALARNAHGFTRVEVQFAVLQISPLACPPSRREGAAQVVASLPEPSRDHWRFPGWTSRWAPWTDHNLDALADAVCDMGRDGERAIRAFGQLLLDGRGTDRISGMLARLLAAVPRPEHGVPARGPLRKSEDSAHRRVKRLVGLLQNRMSESGDRDPVLEEQVDAVLGLLGTREEYAPEALFLVQRRIAVACAPPEGDPSVRELADLLLAGAHLLAREPFDQGDPNRLLQPFRGTYRRSGVEPRVLEAVVRRLFGAASATQGAAGETAALLGLRLVKGAGDEADWDGPWPRLLSRAGDLGHERVRAAAWRMVV
ncbi:hypothetical protein [Nocardiopsis synnemataformans]|uniref:hypothetical protein n=1 Tax=Nocardiopsis synnemataformans TaxID=61305 RepID=UPI003EBE1352